MITAIFHKIRVLSTPPPPHQLSLVLLKEYLLFKCSVAVFFRYVVPNRLQTKKTVCPEALKMAIAMVRSGQMSKKGTAAKMYIYDVSRTTLLDKLAGRVPKEDVRPGKKPILTAGEERKLVDFTNTMCNVCFNRR